ncbi:hypothetical protein [Bythopirellula goksoeyrii]|uniref:Uncharacterized protein n=1 Tax=Bythopirellula goksoeyrii TaxID=1400387 RepID=A0A5B9QAN5_9BACT|nr:hypothetical protein [Bythopirellula goksoeyrii]QEG36154.1 hypothetical protein Pr1d_34630 [Bythopirellula goksoeyrii]
MSPVTKCYPGKLVMSVAVFLFALLMILWSHFTAVRTPEVDSIPVMRKPSLFYHLGKLFDPFTESDRQLHREMWQDSYEIDAFLADPYRSAGATGSYPVAGAGVNSHAVGKLSDQELGIFREQLAVRAGDGWEAAPPDIRRKYERLFDMPPYPGLPR